MDQPERFLSGKVAVVTNSASGLGLFVAASLARAGARIAICHPEMARVEAAYQQLAAIPGVEVLGVACDMRELAEVETMGQQVVDRFGRIDLWVNNAAAPEPAFDHDLDPQAWRASIDMNLTGAFHGTRVALQHMLPRQSGKILNLVEMAPEGPASATSAGAGDVSAAAILRLTRAGAERYQGTGVSIHAMPHVAQAHASGGNQPEEDPTGADRFVAIGERAARFLGVESDGRTGIIYDAWDFPPPFIHQLLRRLRR
jgi:NAD(P)-dependent dehydrogenase (short-subunit alcohol dehydrogenase family)